MVNISQMQAVMLLAQAQSNLNLAVQALQQAILGAQTAGAANVTLSAEALQGLATQIQLAAEAVVQARVRQMQQIMVRIRGSELDIRVRARQMQIANILAQARSSLNATLRTLQRLLADAQVMGGAATIAVAAAQQILAEIRAQVMAVAAALVAQQQTVMILGGQA